MLLVPDTTIQREGPPAVNEKTVGINLGESLYEKWLQEQEALNRKREEIAPLKKAASLPSVEEIADQEKRNLIQGLKTFIQQKSKAIIREDEAPSYENSVAQIDTSEISPENQMATEAEAVSSRRKFLKDLAYNMPSAVLGGVLTIAGALSIYEINYQRRKIKAQEARRIAKKMPSPPGWTSLKPNQRIVRRPMPKNNSGKADKIKKFPAPDFDLDKEITSPKLVERFKNKIVKFIKKIKDIKLLPNVEKEVYDCWQRGDLKEKEYLFADRIEQAIRMRESSGMVSQWLNALHPAPENTPLERRVFGLYGIQIRNWEKWKKETHEFDGGEEIKSSWEEATQEEQKRVFLSRMVDKYYQKNLLKTLDEGKIKDIDSPKFLDRLVATCSANWVGGPGNTPEKNWIQNIGSYPDTQGYIKSVQDYFFTLRKINTVEKK